MFKKGSKSYKTANNFHKSAKVKVKVLPSSYIQSAYNTFSNSPLTQDLEYQQNPMLADCPEDKVQLKNVNNVVFDMNMLKKFPNADMSRSMRRRLNGKSVFNMKPYTMITTPTS